MAHAAVPRPSHRVRLPPRDPLELVGAGVVLPLLLPEGWHRRPYDLRQASSKADASPVSCQYRCARRMG